MNDLKIKAFKTIKASWKNGSPYHPSVLNKIRAFFQYTLYKRCIFTIINLYRKFKGIPHPLENYLDLTRRRKEINELLKSGSRTRYSSRNRKIQ